MFSVHSRLQVLINGLTVLGTSGQNIEDIGKYARWAFRPPKPHPVKLEIMFGRHCSPTCPDPDTQNVVDVLGGGGVKSRPSNLEIWPPILNRIRGGDKAI